MGRATSPPCPERAISAPIPALAEPGDPGIAPLARGDLKAGIVWFAVAVIDAVVILYIINLIVDWIAGQMGGGEPWAVPVKYVLGAIVLIGLLIAAANLLFGYHLGNLHAQARSADRAESAAENFAPAIAKVKMASQTCGIA